jgi:glutamate 5-kinase
VTGSAGGVAAARPDPGRANGPLSAARLAVGRAKIVVVKVGSSSLTTAAGGLDPNRLDALVDAVAGRVAGGSQVVLVSSGAIAAGLSPLGLPRRPRDLATQQAAASVGQQLLAERYAGSFARYRLTVGQILLTSDDVVRRAHYRNAQRTFGKLLSFGVVPVVNENDTVATAEIRFGDNDRLAALVAHLVGAGALILLSDVDALYTGDPRLASSEPVREVADAGALAGIGIASAGSDVGTGGMGSKLTSALTATGAGIPVLLAAAADAVAALRVSPASDDTDGPTVGTAFAPATRRTSARMFWLRHAATSAGSIGLDQGAVNAVVGRRKSLLPAGITHFFGDFESGDVVDLLAPTGEIVARGFVGHDAGELPGIIGRSLPELSPDLRHPVVHADDLVAVPQTNGVPGTSGPASPAPGRTRVGSTASSPIEGVQHVGR